VVIYKRRKNVTNENQSIPMDLEMPHENVHQPIDGESLGQASQPITIIPAAESNTAWLKET
jgi:hypothetical protein